MERDLMHHGIKGQKWGIRRYQNPDGTLTAAGRERYYKDRVKQLKTEYYNKTEASKRSKQGLEKYIRKNYGDTYYKDRDLVDQRRTRRIAAGALAAGTVAVGAICAVGAVDAMGNMSIYNAGVRNQTTSPADRIDNIINDPDTVTKLEADMKMYRVLYGDKDKEKIINDSLHTTDNQADRALYKNFLANMQGGSNNDQKREVTYKLNKDVNVAQGKVLFDFALEAIGSDKKVKDLDVKAIKEYEENSSGWLGGLFSAYTKPPEGYDDYIKAANAIFAMPVKDKSGKLSNEDSIKLRDKLVKEGYGAMKDYIDSGIVGKSPKILLEASKDVSIEDIKDIGILDKVKAKMILGLKNKGQ